MDKVSIYKPLWDKYFVNFKVKNEDLTFYFNGEYNYNRPVYHIKLKSFIIKITLNNKRFKCFYNKSLGFIVNTTANLNNIFLINFEELINFKFDTLGAFAVEKYNNIILDKISFWNHNLLNLEVVNIILSIRSLKLLPTEMISLILTFFRKVELNY
jgi:hypothetical protein